MNNIIYRVIVLNLEGTLDSLRELCIIPRPILYPRLVFLKVKSPNQEKRYRFSGLNQNLNQKVWWCCPAICVVLLLWWFLCPPRVESSRAKRIWGRDSNWVSYWMPGSVLLQPRGWSWRRNIIYLLGVCCSWVKDLSNLRVLLGDWMLQFLVHEPFYTNRSQ